MSRRIASLRLLGAITMFLSGVPGHWLSGQVSPESSVTPNSWHKTPAVPGTIPLDPARQKTYTMRGEAFDQELQFHFLGPDAGSVEDRYVLSDPIPIKESSFVFIATFKETTVDQSPSQESIYTVAHFAVDRVLKERPKDKHIQTGDVVDILFAGGAIRLGDVIKQQRIISGEDTPLELGGRYLLFCQYTQGMDNFSIHKHWKLSGGRVVAVDLFETRNAMLGKSLWNGRPEWELLDATEKAVYQADVQQQTVEELF